MGACLLWTIVDTCSSAGSSAFASAGDARKKSRTGWSSAYLLVVVTSCTQASRAFFLAKTWGQGWAQ